MLILKNCAMSLSFFLNRINSFGKKVLLYLSNQVQDQLNDGKDLCELKSYVDQIDARA